MFPHPDTVVSLWEIRHQELLREAANERLAANALSGRPSLVARIRMGSLGVALWWRGRRRQPAVRHVVARNRSVTGTWRTS